MVLNLFKIKIWEDNGLSEKFGIVIGENFSEAATALEQYYDGIEEINYISPIGDSLVWEINESAYQLFEKLKEEFIW